MACQKNIVIELSTIAYYGNLSVYRVTMTQFLLNIKISSRLWLGFGIKMLLVAILGGLALQHIFTVSTFMTSLVEHPLRVIDETEQAQAKLLTLERDFRALIRADDPALTEELEHNIVQVDQELDALIKESTPSTWVPLKIPLKPETPSKNGGGFVRKLFQSGIKAVRPTPLPS